MNPTTLFRNLAFGLTALIAASLIVATAVEGVAGSAIAHSRLYDAPWMTLLWGLAAVAALVYLLMRRRALTAATALLHGALLIILAGAAITRFDSLSGTLTLARGVAPSGSFAGDSGESVELPFRISLVDFRTEFYPGTSSPSDFVATVALSGEGASADTCRISMNRVLTRDGYRFFLTSMGSDGVRLTVTHDPAGTAVSYAGYLLLFAAMAAFFFTRRSRWRMAVRRLAAICLLGAAAVPSWGAGGVPPTVPKPLADRLGRVCVYWGDRVVPFQTMARDFCTKVYGSPSYRGLTAEQTVCGWLFYYDAWKREPFIRVDGRKTRQILGIGDSRHASLRDFHGPEGYRLESAVAADLSDRALRDTDTRVAMVAMVCTGSALKFFPIPPGNAGEPTGWLSPADAVPAALPTDDYVFMTTWLDGMSHAVADRRWRDAADEVARLREFQHTTAPAGTLPTSGAIRAELIYNRFGSTIWPAIFALALATAAAIAGGRRLRVVVSMSAWLLFAWLTAILALRWIIGRHIPLANGFETMLFMAWLASAIGVATAHGKRQRNLGAASLATAAISLFVATMGSGASTVSPLMPVLSSPLLSVHVLLVMAAYTLFTIIFLLSTTALLSNNLNRPEFLKHLNRPKFLNRPNRPDLRRTALRCIALLYPAVMLLAAGIFVGAIWANQSWGRYWGWDPKETWALITLLIYALPLHTLHRLSPLRSPRNLLLYLSLSFISVLTTYFGVNYLLPGLHSYA